MEKNSIVSRQLAFMLFLTTLGAAFIFVPESVSGRDSWLSAAIGALAGFFILYLIISLQKMRPGVSILQISKQLLGILPGTVFNIIYLIILLLVVVFSLYDITLFMALILQSSTLVFMQALMLVVVIYFGYRGITAIGRSAELFLPPVLLLTILAIAVPVASINWSYFLPLLNSWQPIIAGSFIASTWPFGQIVFVALFLPLVTDLQDNARKLYYWYLLAAVLMVASTIIVIGVAGPETSTLMRFPYFQVIRGIHLPGLQRIELIFFLLWFVISGATVNNLFAALLLGLKEITGVKKTSSLIIPLALLIIILCNYLFPSDIGFFAQKIVAIFLFLPVYVLYPSIIFIAARWQGKKAPPSLKG